PEHWLRVTGGTVNGEGRSTPGRPGGRTPRRFGRRPRSGSFLAAPPRRTVQSARRAPMETYTLRPRPDARPDRRYRIDYAGELNRAQYEAATALEGSVLVIAGAGSGKTRTLVYRVTRLVESGVSPGQILLLTFTRK